MNNQGKKDPFVATPATNIGISNPVDHGNKFESYFCSKPFEFAHIGHTGNLYQCSPQVKSEASGNLFEQDFKEVWNSEKAKKIRASILDGSFKYCSELTCSLLRKKELPRIKDIINPYHKVIIEQGITNLVKAPDTIEMSHDRSCNLACSSCRSEFFVLKEKAKQRAETIHENLLDLQHLKDVKRLVIAGSGDPFGSKLYHSFLSEFDPIQLPDLRITLATNGLLLNQKKWENICSAAIDRIEVSVDGASEKSYFENRGGDFKRLINNLRFLGSLRKSNQIETFELHFVVQKNNFFEMVDFIKLGRKVNADRIVFKPIINRGSYTEQNYLGRAVQLEENALHIVFKDMLQNPIFKSTDVNFRDLSHLLSSEKESKLVI